MNDKLEKIIHLMESDGSVDAPANAIKWVKDLYRANAPQPAASPFRRLIAMLQVDLGSATAMAGERSAAAGKERQMFFTVEEIGVHLVLKEGADTVDIRGQILAEMPGPAKAILRTENGEEIAETVDNDGFRFSGVPKGEYSLSITFDDKEVLIEKLELL